MKYFFYLIAIIILLSLNAGLFPYLRLFGAIPNLLLVLTVVTALDRESHDCFFVALFSGLFLDFYSASYFGTFSFIFLFIAGILQLMVNNFLVFEINWKFAVLVLTFCTFGVYFFAFGFNFFTAKISSSQALVSFTYLKQKAPFELIYNLIMLLPIYKLLEAIKHLLKIISARRRSA